MLKASYVVRSVAFVGASVVLTVGICTKGWAYERYSSCRSCHGDFTGSTSPKGTQFPSGDKHEMHRGSSQMNTECDLCHTNGDNRNPYIGSSNGTSNNAGLGCTGCHLAVGLRAHHDANGVTSCLGCHDAATPPPESTQPPYYGTADTNVDNPCNDNPTAKTGENWSLNDFQGLDNDGDNLYDLADFDCGPPYRLMEVALEGADVRITWETVGGRTDRVQAATEVTGPYTDVSSSISVPGVGEVTRDFVVSGGASSGANFYRIRSVP